MEMSNSGNPTHLCHSDDPDNINKAQESDDSDDIAEAEESDNSYDINEVEELCDPSTGDN